MTKTTYSITLLIILLIFTVVAYGQTGTKFAWTYTQAEVAAEGIIRFELQVDDGPWVDVGMNLLTIDDPDTYFTDIPEGALGDEHTAEIRGCDIMDICSVRQLSYNLTAEQDNSAGGQVPVVVQ